MPPIKPPVIAPFNAPSNIPTPIPCNPGINRHTTAAISSIAKYEYLAILY